MIFLPEWNCFTEEKEETVLATATNAVNGTAAGEITKNVLNGLSNAESQTEVNYFLAGAIGASILTAVVLVVLLALLGIIQR